MARKVFENSIVPLPDEPGLTPQGLMVNAAQPDDKQEPMTVVFSVSTPAGAEEELERKVAAGQTIAAGDVKSYGPDPAILGKLTDWLRSQHFEIVRVSPESASVYARATAAQIEQSLDVKMVRVTKEDLTYTAAQNAPSLPEDVGKNVQAILGLQPFLHAYKQGRMRMPRHSRRLARTSAGADLGPAAAMAGAEAEPAEQPVPPYFVRDILKAYNGDGLQVSGNGQTIAILIDAFPDPADLQAFWSANNIPPVQIEEVDLSGGQLPPPSGEETLDASWTSGIAPGATIRIYATGSLALTALDIALDRILADLPANPGMRQLSISLGLGETFVPKDEVMTEHRKFLRLAAAGVNVFVSSGDAGSSPDRHGKPGGPTQAEYQSSDTAVIGVGGTSLTLAADGSAARETGWVGSGGGKSVQFHPRPTWQSGQGVPPGDQRLVPDVSITADPDLGAFLVLHGKPVQYGGTSWSAPIWAGICALLNEARANGGKPPLPFLNPLIYPLLGTASFRDIVQGSNGAYSATQGYDLVTGLGVPDIRELVNALT